MKTLEQKIAEIRPLFTPTCPDSIIRLRAERERAYETESVRRRLEQQRYAAKLANWID
jgi:hypothetical protein